MTAIRTARFELSSALQLMRSNGFWAVPGSIVLLIVLFVEQAHIITVSTQANSTGVLLGALAGTATAGLLVASHRLTPWVRHNRGTAIDTIAALFAIGIVRTWPQWFLTPSSDLSPGFWYPILQSTIFTVTFGLLVGLTTARVVAVLASMRGEQAARSRLAERKTQTSRALDQTRRAMQTWSEDVVVPAINKALQELSSLTRIATEGNWSREGAHESARRIRQWAADVREASHELDTASPGSLPDLPSAAAAVAPDSPKALLSGLGSQLVTGSPFHPFLITSVALISALGTVYRLSANFVPILIAALTMFVFLYLCHRFASNAIRRLPVGVGIAFIILGFAVAGLAACASIIARQGLGDPATGIRLIALTVLMVATIGVVVSLSAACVNQLELLERETAALTASARWELGRYEGELRSMTEAVSEAVHGEIQGRLVLVALVVDDLGAGTVGLSPDVTVLEPAAESLTHARQQVVRLAEEGADGPSNLTEGLAQLIALWSPPLDIELREPADRAVTEGSQLTDTLLLRAARDTVANAARHGGARRLVIDVSSPGVVVVDDDGVGNPDSIQPRGLSYQHFTRAGGRWTYSRSRLGGIRVTLTAPPT